jgi:hypothetical protein
MSSTLPPNESNKKLLDILHPFGSYKEPIKAMLAIATFAASITYTTILTPRELRILFAKYGSAALALV